MKEIFSLYADTIVNEGKSLVQELLEAYIEELNHHAEWYEDDIPMINYGERCQVGFMAMGLTHKFRSKYAVIQEFKTSSSNSYPDLGVLNKEKKGLHQYFLLEAKYLSESNETYTILEYNQSEFNIAISTAIDQLKSYFKADKTFCESKNTIGVTMTLRPFFYHKQDIFPLENYNDIDGRRKVNKHIAANEEVIKKSPDMYYSLYQQMHKNKNGQNQIVAFEIFGRIFELS